MGKRIDELRATLGANIRRRRTELGLTQAELAQKLGMRQNYISDIERGVRSPRLGTLAEFSEILQVQPGSLLAATFAATA